MMLIMFVGNSGINRKIKSITKRNRCSRKGVYYYWCSELELLCILFEERLVLFHIAAKGWINIQNTDTMHNWMLYKTIKTKIQAHR